MVIPVSLLQNTLLSILFSNFFNYTGRFIMLSVITNIYIKKTKGPTLMKLFTATGKLKKFFLTTRDVRFVHHGGHGTHRYDIQVLDIWLAVHHSITSLLLPTWYTNFLFIHTNYIKLNSSTCFKSNPPIIRRLTTQIVHMQPLVSSLSASNRLVQPQP